MWQPQQCTQVPLLKQRHDVYLYFWLLGHITPFLAKGQQTAFIAHHYGISWLQCIDIVQLSCLLKVGTVSTHGQKLMHAALVVQ